ncbi:MAG: hypothetical protein ACLRJV_08690 [Eubacteriales bacterium]
MCRVRPAKEKYSDNIANTIKATARENYSQRRPKHCGKCRTSWAPTPLPATSSASNGRFTTPSSSQSVSLTERVAQYG